MNQYNYKNAIYDLFIQLYHSQLLDCELVAIELELFKKNDLRSVKFFEYSRIEYDDEFLLIIKYIRSFLFDFSEIDQRKKRDLVDKILSKESEQLDNMLISFLNTLQIQQYLTEKAQELLKSNTDIRLTRLVILDFIAFIIRYQRVISIESDDDVVNFACSAIELACSVVRSIQKYYIYSELAQFKIEQDIRMRSELDKIQCVEQHTEIVKRLHKLSEIKTKEDFLTYEIWAALMYFIYYLEQIHYEEHLQMLERKKTEFMFLFESVTKQLDKMISKQKELDELNLDEDEGTYRI
ncbi:MAG: hypothetical protein GF411_18530 [Candidatus Lokiarchaeota archaeon]|nr:hypothetical protein [Candidatus Lokiarchaeota archaeon]